MNELENFCDNLNIAKDFINRAREIANSFSTSEQLENVYDDYLLHFDSSLFSIIETVGEMLLNIKDCKDQLREIE